jgi:hypothetical protein
MDNPNGSKTEGAAEGEEIAPVSTEVLQKPERRTFPAEYKLRILREANQCRNVDLGALRELEFPWSGCTDR